MMPPPLPAVVMPDAGSHGHGPSRPDSVVSQGALPAIRRIQCRHSVKFMVLKGVQWRGASRRRRRAAAAAAAAAAANTLTAARPPPPPFGPESIPASKTHPVRSAHWAGRSSSLDGYGRHGGTQTRRPVLDWPAGHGILPPRPGTESPLGRSHPTRPTGTFMEPNDWRTRIGAVLLNRNFRKGIIRCRRASELLALDRSRERRLQISLSFMPHCSIPAVIPWTVTAAHPMKC
jgi:hypothetical protein